MADKTISVILTAYDSFAPVLIRVARELRELNWLIWRKRRAIEWLVTHRMYWKN